MLKFSKLSSKALKLYNPFKTGSTVLKQGASADYSALMAKTNVYVLSDVIIHHKHVLHSWRGNYS